MADTEAADFTVAGATTEPAKVLTIGAVLAAGP
jgi:hypothetical protein